MLNARERFHQQIKEALAEKTDSERSKMPLLHDEWRVGRECVIGRVYRYQGDLYRCNQTHTTRKGWEPDITAALFIRIMYKDGIRIIPDVITATQAFALDELGWQDGHTYRSKMHGNVFPVTQTDAWEMIE